MAKILMMTMALVICDDDDNYDDYDEIDGNCYEAGDKYDDEDDDYDSGSDCYDDDDTLSRVLVANVIAFLVLLLQLL